MARKALLAGINDYKGISDLRGCLNDLWNIRDVLKNTLGFRNEDIRVFYDLAQSKNRKQKKPTQDHWAK